MAASCANIDVIITSNADLVPSCVHGPALLFERYTQKDGSRKFFACSAFRDRKDCSFFRWADDFKPDKVTVSADRHRHVDADNAVKSCTSVMGHVACRKRFLKFKKLPLSKRSLCCTCGLLLLEEEVSQHDESGHQLKHGISRAALQRPTSLFVPQENNKTFAQYLFADATVDFVLTSLEKLGSTHILCVGAPRIHEAISVKRKQQNTRLNSLLLDLDSRYAQVYPPKKMCLYNMFNHHFFDGNGETQFKSFLREADTGLVIVTDPPFGGMVQPLAATFTKIENIWKATTNSDKALPILWFFPYFMEKRVCECMPSLTMLDYKVDYDNHTLFQSKEGKRKKGSPVRIFTNVCPISFPLPASEGYWFCKVCQRYSAAENKHCEKCASCTSKDGTTYAHCDLCQRCVKSTRVHCQVCGTCELPSHTCGHRGEGCHVCGAMDHKRRNCPKRHNPAPRDGRLKRSAEGEPARARKKRRTK